MDVNELKELIELFENTELSELELEEDGRRIRLQRGLPGHAVAPPISMVVPSAVPAPQPEVTAPEAAPEEEVYAEVINSPMVGTFYAASAPGEAVFVQEGDQVEEGHTVCIVEAMKLMNEVGAVRNCVIEKILVENGQPVEFGQPLFAVRHI